MCDGCVHAEMCVGCVAAAGVVAHPSVASHAPSQVAVHGDAPAKVTPAGYRHFLVESPLGWAHPPPWRPHNAHPSSQVAVHGDPPEKITPAGYRHFLVESPLERVAAGRVRRAPRRHRCVRCVRAPALKRKLVF